MRASAAPRRDAPAPPAAADEVPRRRLLALAAALPAALPALRLALAPKPAHAATAVDWAAVRADIRAVISDPSFPGGIGEKGPTLGACAEKKR